MPASSVSSSAAIVARTSSCACECSLDSDSCVGTVAARMPGGSDRRTGAFVSRSLWPVTLTLSTRSTVLPFGTMTT
jgi:hypothetical protein